MTLQQGVGAGTTARKRRDPRMRVQDVAVTEASGLTLGTDGYPHPLETSAEGELQTSDRPVATILEEVLRELVAIREGMEVYGIIPGEK